MLFAIGAGPQVVGVSSFDDYPAEVRNLERVGALLDPDLEARLLLRALLRLAGFAQDFRFEAPEIWMTPLLHPAASHALPACAAVRQTALAQQRACKVVCKCKLAYPFPTTQQQRVWQPAYPPKQARQSFRMPRISHLLTKS